MSGRDKKYWQRWYIAVTAVLVLQVAAYYWFTRYYH